MTEAAQARQDHVRVRGAESRIEFSVVGVFSLLVAGTLAYVHTIFAPTTPPRILWAWTAFMGASTIYMFSLSLIVWIRKPSDEEIFRVWSRAGKVAAVWFDLGCAASVWMLLPYADEQLRLLMVVFYAASISGQVASTAESLGTVAFGIVAVLGSAALFFLQTPGPYSMALALFLGAFGALLLGVAVTLKAAVRSALVARLRAERAASELAGALADARAARDARTRFMAAASHDLRQPLQAAVLFFQQLIRARDERVRARAEAGVRLAFEETDALLERMLDHLRLDAGAVEARLAPLSVSELFARVAAEAQPLVAAERMRLKASPTPAWVCADPALAGGVMRNFVHNALRHAGGRQIRLMARRRGDKVRLYVLDDGRGVPLQERATLFEPYVQGARSASQGRSGLGLGLASARRMAELMGGEAALDVTWTGGAAFYLELPRAERPVRSDAVCVPGPGTVVGRRVLIVDDDDAAREALAGVFAAEGWDALTAADAGQARRLAERGPCDLLITDWRLADGATGAEAVDAVRRAHPDVPALLVTGDGSRESHAAIASTGLPVLFKPTAPARILAMAEQLCRSGS